jgi:FMN-dependent NADH-azoreductase
MARLLYLQASPRGQRSKSIAAADAFADHYRRIHPLDTVEIINVFSADLPPFDGLAVQAKYNILHGNPHDSAEQNAWRAVETLIEQFKSADKYLLAVPMWNFTIPYRLKQYFDLIVQPGYTFGFSPEKGYFGLVTGKPLVVVYSRGGEYPPGTPYDAFDLQTRYVQLIFRHIGFTDIRSLVFEPTLRGTPREIDDRANRITTEAQRMAEKF